MGGEVVALEEELPVVLAPHQLAVELGIGVIAVHALLPTERP